MNDPDDLLLALKSVAEAFASLGTRYYVGGSIASSFHGAMRSTMDVDLLCELDESHVEELVRLIGSDYYASKPAIYDAIRRQSCFNLIHRPPLSKSLLSLADSPRTRFSFLTLRHAHTLYCWIVV